MAGNQRPWHQHRPGQYERRQNQPSGPYGRYVPSDHRDAEEAPTRGSRDQPYLPPTDLFAERARYARDGRAPSSDYRDYRSPTDSFHPVVERRDLRDRSTSRHSPTIDYAEPRNAPSYARQGSDASLSSQGLRRRSPSPSNYGNRGGGRPRGDFVDYRAPPIRTQHRRASADLIRRVSDSGRFPQRRQYESTANSERERLDREREARDYKFAVQRVQNNDIGFKATSERPKGTRSGDQDGNTATGTPPPPRRGSAPEASPSKAEQRTGYDQNLQTDSHPGRRNSTSISSVPARSHDLDGVYMASRDNKKSAASPSGKLDQRHGESASREAGALEEALLVESPRSISRQNDKSASSAYVNPFDLLDNASSIDGSHKSPDRSCSPNSPPSNRDENRNDVAILEDALTEIYSPRPESEGAVSLEEDGEIAESPFERARAVALSPAASEASTIHLPSAANGRSHENRELTREHHVQEMRDRSDTHIGPTLPEVDAIGPLHRKDSDNDMLSIASDMDNLRSSPENANAKRHLRQGVADNSGLRNIVELGLINERIHDEQLIAQLSKDEDDVPNGDEAIESSQRVPESETHLVALNPGPRTPEPLELATTLSQIQTVNHPSTEAVVIEQVQALVDLVSNEADESFVSSHIPETYAAPGRTATQDHSVITGLTSKNISGEPSDQSHAESESETAKHDEAASPSKSPAIGSGLVANVNGLDHAEGETVTERSKSEDGSVTIQATAEITSDTDADVEITRESNEVNLFRRAFLIVQPRFNLDKSRAVEICSKNKRHASLLQSRMRRRTYDQPQQYQCFESNLSLFKSIKPRLTALLCAKKKNIIMEEEQSKREYSAYMKRWQKHAARCDRDRLLEFQQEEAEAVLAASSVGPTRGTRNKPVGYELKEALDGIDVGSNVLNEASIPALIKDPVSRELFNYEDLNCAVAAPLEYYHISVDDPRNQWTQAEQDTFSALYKLTPKQFGAIAAGLPGRTPQDCVLHYYLTKKALDYRQSGKPKLRASARGRGRARKVVVTKSTRRSLLANVTGMEGEEESAEDEMDNKALRKRRAPTDLEETARKKSLRKTIKKSDNEAAKIESLATAQSSAKSVQYQSMTPPLPAPILQSSVLSDSEYDLSKRFERLPWYEPEEAHFVELLKRFGTNFSAMPALLPGRTLEQIQEHFNEYLIDRGYRQYLPRPGLQASSVNPGPLLHGIRNIPTAPSSHRPVLNPPSAYQPYQSYEPHRGLPPQPSQQRPPSQLPSFGSSNQTHQSNYNSLPYNFPPPGHYEPQAYRHSGTTRLPYDARSDSSRGPLNMADRPPPIRGSIDSMLNSGERVQLPPIGGDLRGGPPGRYGSYYQEPGGGPPPFAAQPNQYPHQHQPHPQHHQQQQQQQHGPPYDHGYHNSFRGPSNQQYYR